MRLFAFFPWRSCALFLLAAALAACGGGSGGSGGGIPSPGPSLGEVTLFAGALDNAGYTDGAPAVAQFRAPRALVQDAAGNTYVADTGNHAIRKIAPDGTVAHYAGLATQPGSDDGAAATARFTSPQGMALDVAGNLYVADTGNHTIRRISTAGVVTTFAGAAGRQGAVNGPAAMARFDAPRALAFDAMGNLLVADRSGALRSIRPDGEVSTFAGMLGTSGFAVGDREAARFTGLNAVTVDGEGTVVVAEYDAQSSSVGRVRRFDASGRALPWGTATDGVLSVPSPMSLAAAANGEVLVASSGVFAPVPSVIQLHSAILRIRADGQWALLAGGEDPRPHGSSDGPALAARFYLPEGVAAGIGGRVLVADTGNNTIRQIEANGTVSTLAGRASIGRVDGQGTAARFFDPRNIGAMPDGTLFVADSGNAVVRRVTPLGLVSTQSFTQQAGTSFTTHGRGITALATSPDGKLYVSRYFSNSVYDIIEADVSGSARVVSTRSSFAMAADDGGRLYYSTGNPDLELLRDGTTTTIPTGAQSAALAVDAAGNVYSAGFDHAIRVISGTGVRVLAGAPGQPGAVDGTTQTARFNQPSALATDPFGNVYVADRTGIRRVGVDGRVLTVSASPSQITNPFGDNMLHALRKGAKGLAWSNGMLYATIDNAILRIGPFQ